MWGPIRRFVDLRAGEELSAAQSAATLALIIAAHTMLETARDALFLGKLPADRLAFVYAGLAILSLLAVKRTQHYVLRFGRRNAFILSLMAASYGTVVLYLVPTSEASVFALYLWSGLLGTILVIQFWLLAGQLFTVSQGKRLFGPLASGGVLGAVIGAGASAALLNWVDVRALIPIAAGLFLLTALLLSTVKVEDTPTSLTVDKKKRASDFNVFRGRPYLRRVAALIVVVTAAVLMTDYLFKSVAAASMSKEALGPFFARYYTGLNTVSFIVQVFVSGYILRRVGVVSAVVFMPMLLMIGGIGALAFGGGLMVVMMTKGVDGALRHSLHRVSTELLWMPVPDRDREQAKSVVDSVLVRGTQAGVAGLILFLSMMELGSPEVFAGAIASFAAFAAFLAFGLRRPYLDLFRDALGGRGDVRVQFDLDLRSVEVVVEALSSLEPPRVLAAIDLLEVQDRAKLIPSLILYHDSEEVLIRALAVIATPDRNDWQPLTRRLLTHDSEEVREAAIRAFAKTREGQPYIEERLQDISPSVRAHAAYWLVQRASDTTRPERDARIQDCIAMEGDAGARSRIALLDAIADGADERWAEVLLEITRRAESGEVISHAALAMQKIKDERFVPLLIERLATRDGRGAVRSALESQGEPAQEALEAALDNEDLDPRVRLHIPRSISWFENQRAADYLIRRIDNEPHRRVRYKILRALHRLAADGEVKVEPATMERQLHRDLVRYFNGLTIQSLIARESSLPTEAQSSHRLLLSLLDDRLEQTIERIFLVLETLHRHEDMRTVRLALQSNESRARAQAAEFLDGLALDSVTSLGAESRELIRLLADDLSREEKVERARPYMDSTTPQNEDAALVVLMNSDQDIVASIAIYYAIALDRPSLNREIRRVTKTRPALISVDMKLPSSDAIVTREEIGA